MPFLEVRGDAEVQSSENSGRQHQALASTVTGSQLNTTLRMVLKESMYGQNIVRDSLGKITLTDLWRPNGREQSQRQRDRLRGSRSNPDYCLWLSWWFLKAGLLNVATFFQKYIGCH